MTTTTHPDQVTNPDHARSSPSLSGVGATVSGYPRQGERRALKRALESHWAGRSSAAELLTTAAGIRAQRWADLSRAGLDEVPVGEANLYDHVLDATVLLGALPARFGDLSRADAEARLATRFALARGTTEQPPLEMTKWFDTNYHYLVPELGPETSFDVEAADLLAELAEAAGQGLDARPVVVGPFTWLALAKADDDHPGFDPLTLLPRLVPAYAELLSRLGEAGAQWVQLDEPALVLDQEPAVLAQVQAAYRRLAETPGRPRLLVGTAYGALREAAPVLLGLPVEGIGVDLSSTPGSDVRGANLAALRELAPQLAGRRLLAGVVDGRNVWRSDLSTALAVLEELAPLVGRLDVTPSCSLLHVPLDLAAETSLDPEVRGWLAFARQKLDELAVLARGVAQGRAAVAVELAAAVSALASRAASPLVRRDDVRARVAGLEESDARREVEREERLALQQQRLGLPLLPTTTIGSFPQTSEVRLARAARRRGELDEAGYTAAMEAEIARVVQLQTRLGLDVLVHGEPERNDMVQYFAESLAGFVTSEEGWVQSYGSRFVRPPIVVGDVARPEPITVAWTRYAGSLTERPVKGMLTGPVTVLAWSFGRDDVTPAETATQLALALRDEVVDLAAAGVEIVQVDEPALRETLPLRRDERATYLDWAVRAFRVTTAGVGPATQIHTHMCYAEFGEIIDAVLALDADVISLEAARSRMEVVADLTAAGYPAGVGPGVWDIHSPRVPSSEEVVAGLRSALAGGIAADRLWVNPDCGLKTRGYAEVEASLAVMVAAAATVRTELPG